MTARFCASCGAPAPAGAGFCAYCGAPLSAGGPGTPPGTPPATPAPLFPPPLPAAPTLGGRGPFPSYGYPTPAPTPKRRRWLVVAVVVVVAILLVGAIAFLATGPAPITVTGINFVSPDNACGLNGDSDYGFNGSAGQSLEFTYDLFDQLPNNATVGCTLTNITTTTPGFSVTGANTPLTIPAGNGSTQLFSFQVNFPSSGYTGVLTLVIT